MTGKSLKVRVEYTIINNKIYCYKTMTEKSSCNELYREKMPKIESIFKGL